MIERAQVIVERLPSGAYLLVESAAVHTHACPAWRMRTRHGPCHCGAEALWSKYEAAIRPLIEAIPTALSDGGES